jgi:hypothetical protein
MDNEDIPVTTDEFGSVALELWLAATAITPSPRMTEAENLIYQDTVRLAEGKWQQVIEDALLRGFDMGKGTD